MDWKNILKENRRKSTIMINRKTGESKEVLDIDEDLYLYTLTKSQKREYHRKMMWYYQDRREFMKAREHREIMDKMNPNTSDRKFVLGMRGQPINEELVKVNGQLLRQREPKTKEKKNLGRKMTTRASMEYFHNKFSSGAWSLDDMIEMHGKQGYRNILMQKLKESEEE